MKTYKVKPTLEISDDVLIITLGYNHQERVFSLGVLCLVFKVKLVRAFSRRSRGPKRLQHAKY